MADFLNTAAPYDPLAAFRAVSPMSFSGTQPGDPGTYQDPTSGIWYDSGGRQISFNNMATDSARVPHFGGLAPSGDQQPPPPPAGPTAAPSAAIAPYGQTFTTPPYAAQYQVPTLPSYLQQPFTLPSYQDFQTNNPQFTTGFNTALQGLERGAAAQGSLLSGGEQKAITKFATDYGSSHYQDYVNNLLQERQNAFGEYLANAGLSSGAFAQNQTAYQNQVKNALNQFQTNYQQYMDLINNNRNASNDYWSHLLGTTQQGLQAATGPTPPTS